MFLTSPTGTLEVSFCVNHGENSYLVSASTESFKCFERGVLGHKCFACSRRDDQRPSISRAETVEHLNDGAKQRSVGQDGVTEEVSGNKCQCWMCV